MKSKSTRLTNRSRADRKAAAKPSPVALSNSRIPRCSRCGSRTVHFEKMHQELLATISVHCLICGHHMFLGKPVVRLLRRPTLPKSTASPKARTSA